ncbi:MAG: TlpA family protein disulfide reductase [Firmicutes bacterium]|nr:TlpA family protein disulfide reductase [Bacillota bacterium]
MRNISLIVFLCLIAVAVLGWSGSVLAEDSKVLVPDFALVSTANETIRLSDYRGQIVVLNFWASWCPPCRAEMPEFQELHDQFTESGEAVLLLLNQIDRQETVEKGKEYLKSNNYTMTNLLDYGAVGRQIFGIPGLPTTVVIDAEGYLASYVVGATTKETVLQMIEDAR